MATVSSPKMQLTGSNQLWIELIYNQSISGTKNTVSVTMRVRTRWYITGTWLCQLIVDNQSTGMKSCVIQHGSYSVENQGYTDVLSKTVIESYTGNKTISMSAIIYNMDYQDVITGAYGVFNPTFNTSVSLTYIAPPNTAPPVPTLKISNPVYSSKYVVENTLDVELSSVKDPNGDKVVYIIQCDKKEPGSDSWTTAGDSYHNILYSIETRKISLDISKYNRGTSFRVRGQARDTNGLNNGYTSWVENIIRNYAPGNAANIYPNTANIYTDTINLSWDKASDKDNMPLTYTVMLSKNGDSYKTVANKINNLYLNYDISSDPLNTTYQFKIITNDIYTSSTGKVSIKYSKKDNRPSTPTNINPSSGYYNGSVLITWNSSTNPTGNAISKYNIMINKKVIASSNSNKYTWNIPTSDSGGTSYKISIEAISEEGIKSDIGYASGPFYKSYEPKGPSYINPTNIYHEKNIDLNWEKVISNNIQCTYELSVNINSDKWILLKADLNATSYNFDLSKYNYNDNLQFRIRSINSFKQYSNYVYSISYIKNKLPNIPILQYPVNNSMIYNDSPRICITIPKKETGQKLILFVEVNGKIYRSDTNLDFFSNKNKTFSETTNIIFKASNITSDTNFSMYLYDGESYSQKIKFKYKITSINADSIVNSSNGYISAAIFSSIKTYLNNLNDAYCNNSEITRSIKANDYIYFDIINEFRENISMINSKISNFDILNSNFDKTFSWTETSVNSFITKDIIAEIINYLKIL